MNEFSSDFLKAFLLLVAVMDPFATVPVVLSLTNEMPPEVKKKSIDRAILVAGFLLFVFLFGGKSLLKFLGVTLPSFRVAGGIILLIVSLELVLELDLRGKKAQQYDVAVVPLATPLVTGPGVIVTVMLLVVKYGYLIPVLVSLLCLLLTWGVLRQTSLIYKVIGRQGIDIFSRIMGLLLAGLAVEFIRVGLRGQ